MGLVLFLIFLTVVFVLLKHIKTLTYSVYRKCRQIWLIQKIPGPLSLPIVGTTWQFKWKIEELTIQLREWQTYYQTRLKVDMVRIWLGPFPVVVLMSPRSSKVILESNEHIMKGDEYKIMERWLGNSLLISHGDKWRSRRKLITPAFHFHMLNEYQHVHNEEAEGRTIFVQQLIPFAKSGQVFDAFPFIKRCALDIICATAMGVKINAQIHTDHPYVNAVKRMNELSFAYTRMPWLWIKSLWYLSGYGAEYDEMLKVVTDFTRDVISTRGAQFQADPTAFKGKGRTAFLDLLLEVQKEGNLTDEDIRAEVDTFMFEGHDTTSTGMTWTLWCLAHNQQYQNKVLEEIDQVFGNSPRACTVDDLKHLPYLDQCIKESLRLYPPVPFFTRKLQQDIECSGYTIPEDTTICICPGTLGTDDNALKEPFVFNPDNFKLENISQRDPFSYIPFSAGPRNCIGQKFAMMEEKTVLAWFFRFFQVFPAEKFEKNTPCPEITLKPSIGLPVTLKLRSRMGRGLFVVFEGLDRSGKSTQTKKVCDYFTSKGLSARIQRYPDRSEPQTGKLIDDFLRTATDVTQDAVKMHNLFVQNRKELEKTVRKELNQGSIIIADRYSFSGIAYSAAKEIPELSLTRACESEVGLLKPDLVILLNADTNTTSTREGFGGEALEKTEFQSKVFGIMKQIKNDSFWQVVDATGSIDEVFGKVQEVIDEVYTKHQNEPKALGGFSLSDFNLRDAHEA